MKRLIVYSLFAILLSSCSASKTVYLSNKTGNTITLLVDSSHRNAGIFAFKDSLNNLKIARKRVFDFGKGKWTKEDKACLTELIKHTKIIKDGGVTPIDMPGKTKVSLISLNVEELWINIK